MNHIFSQRTPQKPKRVIAFIDGYNLYHSIDNAKRNDLKWLNLWELCEQLLPRDKSMELVDVLYFSAYFKWKRERYAIHRDYVKALEFAGVKPILGNFKKKQKEFIQILKEYFKSNTEYNKDVRTILNGIDDFLR